MSATTLYRMYDEVGDLLYVGICANPRRLDEHKGSKDWWQQVDHIAVSHFPDRTAARAAEFAAIREERPRYNVQHSGRYTPRAVAPTQTSSRIRAAREAKGWSREVLARKSDTAPLTILRAEVHGSDPAASTLLAWATALDVTVSELVGDHDPAAA